MACDTFAEPLQLPIVNITLDTGSTFSRGISIGIGTPQQLLSLLPKTYVRQVVLSNAAQCDPDEPVCLSAFGGRYQSAESSTFSQVTMSQWNASKDNENLRNEDIWFYDSIAYGSNSSAEGFPLVMKKAGFDLSTDVEQGTIGLDAGSLFLAESFKSGSAPSTAFGVYAGSRSLISPDDGLLVIGGYDQARIDGELAPQTYDPDCTPCLTVQTMTYSNGHVNATIELEPFQIVADPSARYLGLPPEVYQNFKNILNTTDPAPYYPDMLDVIDDFGDLHVEFSSGLQVMIPADEIFFKLTQYNTAGDLELIDNTTHAVLADNTEEKPPGLNVWGLPFTSQFYFLIDHEREEWSLGWAKKDADFVDQAYQPDIVPICALESESHNSSSAGTTTNKGAIAGGVVGGLVALALLIAGFWFWRRRSRRRADSKQSTKPASAADESSQIAEMDPDEGPGAGTRKEMDANEAAASVYEKMSMPTYELAGDTPVAKEMQGSLVSPATRSELDGSTAISSSTVVDSRKL